MAKKTRSLRLSDKTWSQLDELTGWLQVDDKTKAIELLIEKEYEKMSGWLTAKYHIGQVIQAPHPADNEMRSATITTFTVDKSENSFSNRPNGVMVRFEDGTYMEVSQGYLSEDGTGL